MITDSNSLADIEFRMTWKSDAATHSMRGLPRPETDKYFEKQSDFRPGVCGVGAEAVNAMHRLLTHSPEHAGSPLILLLRAFLRISFGSSSITIAAFYAERRFVTRLILSADIKGCFLGAGRRCNVFLQ